MPLCYILKCTIALVGVGGDLGGYFKIAHKMCPRFDQYHVIGSFEVCRQSLAPAFI